MPPTRASSSASSCTADSSRTRASPPIEGKARSIWVMTGGWSGRTRSRRARRGPGGGRRGGKRPPSAAGVSAPPRGGRPARGRRPAWAGRRGRGGARGGGAARFGLAGEEGEDAEEEGEGARHERAPRRARRHAGNVRAQVEKRLRSPRTLSELSVTVPMLLP